jgi:hypothetical protein
MGNYGALIRMLLLSTQRFDKVLTMAWVDIDADGVWRIPTVSKREKPHGGELKLPRLARDLLAAMPILEGNPFVFAGRGRGPDASVHRTPCLAGGFRRRVGSERHKATTDLRAS